MGISRTSLAALVLAACAAMSFANPHDGLDHQIAEVTSALRQSSNQERSHVETLLIRRGELYRLHEEWDAAFADLAAVRESRSTQAFVLCHARLFRDVGFNRAAVSVLSTHLKASAEDDQARLLRADVLERLGRFAEALSDFDRSLAKLQTPQPDHYVARARVASKSSHLGAAAIPRALKGLDEGLVKLGLVSSLQQVAIDFEMERAEYDLALDRLETLRKQSKRLEQWHARRGDILMAAGRYKPAKRAYQASLASIRSLGPRQRTTAMIEELERSVAARFLELHKKQQATRTGHAYTQSPKGSKL